MGIKYLWSHLKAHPELKHEIHFEWNNDKDTNGNVMGPLHQKQNIIVWDAPGWLRRCFCSHSRSVKLFGDFKQLDRECKKLIATFKRFGFEVVAFIDGYFCADKVEEKRIRKKNHLKQIRKNIQILHQIHAAKDMEERERLFEGFDWVKSSGFFDFFERALTDSGCTVYRGSGSHDIDRDIARFVVEHKDSVYGIISKDSDYFGFDQLPNGLKLINEFHVKTTMNIEDDGTEQQKRGRKRSIKSQSLSFTYYRADEMWQRLNIRNSNESKERLKIICLVGNDFIKKRSAEEVLRRCGIKLDHDQIASGSKQNESDSKQSGSDMKMEEGDDAEKAVPDQIPSENGSNQTSSDMELEDDDDDDGDFQFIESVTTKMTTLSLDETEQKEIAETKENDSATVTVRSVSTEPIKMKEATKEVIKHDVFEVAANAILNGSLTAPITVPDVVKEFYTIDITQKLKMESNLNPTFSDLMTEHVFNGGFYFHDIDAVAFCVHQKVAPLRRALFFNSLKMNEVTEYIPEFECSPNTKSGAADDEDAATERVDVWKHSVIDLKQQRFQGLDVAVKLVTEWRESGFANLYKVFESALQILRDRHWIDRVQSVALELQFQIRSLSGLKRVYPQWPFYKEYREWIQSAFPLVQDLTACSLYSECARLLCLNQKNLMPPIHKLFDGPLFHFFCYLQRSGDPKGFIQQMVGALKAMNFQRGRDREIRCNVNETPICSFYDGTMASCRNGIRCRFQHIEIRSELKSDGDCNWRERADGGNYNGQQFRGRMRGRGFRGNMIRGRGFRGNAIRGRGFRGRGMGHRGNVRGYRGRGRGRVRPRGYRGRGYGYDIDHDSRPQKTYWKQKEGGGHRVHDDGYNEGH